MMNFNMLCDVVNTALDRTYAFTIPEAWDASVSICLGIAAIYGVIKIGVELKNIFTKPERTQDDRLTNLEKGLKEVKAELNQVRSDFKQDVNTVVLRYEDLIAHYYVTRNKHDEQIFQTQRGLVILMRSTQNMIKCLQGTVAYDIKDTDNDALNSSIQQMEDFIDEMMLSSAKENLNNEKSAK